MLDLRGGLGADLRNALAQPRLERYIGVKQDMQDLAQQLLIFGTHVHVGIEDKDFLVDALNVSRYLLPHVLALSASSPFWQGRNTGLKSYRSIIFRNFPRTGVPRIMRGWGDFAELQETLVLTKCIPDGSKIYWDVRPHHAFPTLEFRFLDVCTRVEEAVCVAALLQAIIAKLWKLRRDNMTFRVYAADLIEENKWRAVRYGLEGNLIDFGTEQERPARELVAEQLRIDGYIPEIPDIDALFEEIPAELRSPGLPAPAQQGTTPSSASSSARCSDA